MAAPLSQQAQPPVASPSAGDETAPQPAGSATVTTLQVNAAPTTFGQPLVLFAAVELLGPAIVVGKPIDFYLDDTKIGTSVLLIPDGPTKFRSFFPVSFLPQAGTHTVTARFAGSESEIPGLPSALPSTSEGTTIVVAQAPTQTTILESPTSPAAFAPIDVVARVSSAVPGLAGTAVLLADGSPVQTETLAADGTVRFEQAEVPWGVNELTVAYTGDASGNWANSTSEAVAYGAREIGTSANLSLSTHQLRAIDTVTAELEVRADGLGAHIDPRGGIEILVDGEVFYAEASSDDRDATQGDGVSRFEATLSGLTPGSHQVSARYLPAPGFGGAEIAPVELNVRAVETVLTPAESELHGTPAHPATVDVTVALAEEEPGTDPDPEPETVATRSAASAAPAEAFLPNGTVQVFVGDEPLGEPFVVTDGAGTTVLAGLPVGTHEIDLRFVPAEQGLLRSSATVTAIIVADETDGGTDGETDGGTDGETDGGTEGGSAVTPKTPSETSGGALAKTGGADQSGILLGGATLLLGAGAALTVARARRRNS